MFFLIKYFKIKNIYFIHIFAQSLYYLFLDLIFKNFIIFYMLEIKNYKFH